MATITIYRCDRCATEYKDRKELMVISAGVGSYYGSDSWSKRWSMDVCTACRHDMGIVMP